MQISTAPSPGGTTDDSPERKPWVGMRSTRSELQLESARWTLSPMRGCADTPAAPTEYGRSRRASSAVEQFSKTLESRAPLREDLKIDLLGDLRANC